jgi:hypothetical protein
VLLSRGGASAASERGVAASHLCGQLERPAHGFPFTDRLGRSHNWQWTAIDIAVNLDGVFPLSFSTQGIVAHLAA